MASSTTSTPTDDKVVNLIAEAEQSDTALAAAIVLASITGARRGGLAAAPLVRYRPSPESLRISRSLTAAKGEWSEGATKVLDDHAKPASSNNSSSHRLAPDRQSVASARGLQPAFRPAAFPRASEGKHPGHHSLTWPFRDDDWAIMFEQTALPMNSPGTLSRPRL